MSINSPNMQLPIPVVGVDSGPGYATSIDNCLTIIDGHTHASGSGVQITPSAININASLPMNNFALTNIKSLTLTNQTVTPAANNIYANGSNLYWIGSGTAVQITSGNSIVGAAGTITGLPSGTASAAYNSGTFVFQAATSTAANIDGAAFIFRNATPNSTYGITLQAPAVLGANSTLTLPAVPASTQFMSIDSSGNMGSSINVTAGITAANIANSTITGTQIASSVALAGSPTLSRLPGGGVAASVASASTLGVIKGAFNAAGNNSLGEGFTASRLGLGHYRVTYTTPFTGTAIPMCTAYYIGTSIVVPMITAVGNLYFEVQTNFAGTSALVDNDVVFIVAGLI